MGVKHAFVSAQADGADATQVRPSNWNADHVMDARGLVGRADAGPGATAELAVFPDAQLGTHGLDVAAPYIGYAPSRFYPPVAWGLAGSVLAPGVLYGSPIIVYRRQAWNLIGLRTGNTAGAGQTLRFGIYTCTSDGLPGTLIEEIVSDVSPALANTGYTAAFATARTLDAGPYWLAVCSSPYTTGCNTAAWPSNAIGGGGFGQLVGGTSVPSVTNVSAQVNRLVRPGTLTYTAGAAFFPATFGTATIDSQINSSPILVLGA